MTFTLYPYFFNIYILTYLFFTLTYLSYLSFSFFTLVFFKSRDKSSKFYNQAKHVYISSNYQKFIWSELNERSSLYSILSCVKYAVNLFYSKVILIALKHLLSIKHWSTGNQKKKKMSFFNFHKVNYFYYNNSTKVIFFKTFILLYTFFKKTIIALLLSFLYIVYTIYFFQLQFLKQLAIWLVIGLIFYWLISGFNFFVKHYQFGKFTSQIQRFWKRTNTCFWLIEGFLILIFFLLLFKL